MADQQGQSEGFPIQEQKTKKPIIIILIVVGLLVLVATAAAIIFWPKTISPVPVSLPAQTAGGQITNTPAINIPVPPVTDTNVPTPTPTVAPPIAPGVNRPLTAAEKQKYGFSTADDIWMKTSSPTNGSQPVMSFYNKTVNPNPFPTTPVIVPGD